MKTENLYQKVKTFSKTWQLFRSGDRLVAGISGGADSVCLLFVLKNLCEELGDELFQEMLNSQIAKEKGLFSVDDVIGGICEKMVRRHPWVFGGEKINSTEEGEALWARIKMQEKAKKP